MFIYEEAYKDLPPINENFTLITQTNQQLRHNLKEGMYSESEYLEDMAKYMYANLNQGQKRLYDAVFENPTAIHVIQAGPGTGKTFTLLSIAHNWPNPSHVVINNHNRLYQFRYCSLRYTAARFFMTMLGINFKEYKKLEHLLSGKMSKLRFVMAIVNILSKATLPPWGKGLLILDEYLVLPKPLLLVTLLLCTHAKIGVILSGDKNRLQNIYNSSHMGQYSSLDIASAFTDRIYRLVKNERCSDTEYNGIVRYVSRFSSDHPVDDFMRAIITAVFPKQLLGVIKFNSVHLATSNKELKDFGQSCIDKKECSFSKYGFIERANINRADNIYYTEKFGPDLPLSIGGRYYVYNISDQTIAELKEINYNPEHTAIESLSLETAGGISIDVQRNLISPKEDSDDYLYNLISPMKDSDDYLYNNFPLYPADLMTLHKCQGCTISRPIVAHLDHFHCKYQGVYVVMSCCTSPQCIETVNIWNKWDHLLSYIINFHESIDPAFTMTANVLEDHMKKYFMCKPKLNFDKKIQDFIQNYQNYFNSKSSEERARIRAWLELHSNKNHQLSSPDINTHQEDDTLTIITFLKYRKVFLSAACIPPQDLGLWLMELCRVTPLFTSLLSPDKGNCSGYEGQGIPEITDSSYNYLNKYANLFYMSDTMKQADNFIETRLANTTANDYQTEKVRITKGGKNIYVSQFQKRIYDLHKDKEFGPSSVTTELLFDWLNKWGNTYGQR